MLNNIIFSPASPVLAAAALRPRIQPLYDRQTVGTAQAATVTFFQTPIGGSGVTIHDTNMRLAGTLPNPNIAEVHAIYVEPLQNYAAGTAGYAITDLKDYVRLISTVVFRFIVGTSNRPICEGPVEFFPAPFGVTGYFNMGSSTATGVGTALLGNGIKDYRSYFGISAFPELLTPSEAFNCELVPDGTLSLSASIDVRVVLGCLYGQGL